MVIVGEPTCMAMGEENDEHIVSMASHSLIHNGNGVAGTVGTTSPIAQLAMTPEGHRHACDQDHPRARLKVEDDELTSLSWLQDTNLLRNIRVGVQEEEEEDYEDELSHSPFSDDCQDEEEEGAGTEFPRTTDRDGASQTNFGLVEYNPRIHVSSKPPYSFSCLIFMAIEDTPNKALPVKEIYAWIVRQFPYYQNAPTGWKNSVRHNLSLNKCFRKVEKDKGQSVGKGSLWCIDPEFRPNLLQTLKKAPQCPFSQLEDIPLVNNNNSCTATSALPESELLNIEIDSKDSSQGTALSNTNVPSPDLFPYLAKRLSVSTVKSSEVDAAATMLSLKNGASCQSSISKASSEEEITKKPKLKIKRKKKNNRFRSSPGYKEENSRARGFHPSPAHPKSQPKQPSQDQSLAAGAFPTGPVITSSPSEDHTYSASPSQASSSGSDHNSCGGSPVTTTEDRQGREEQQNGSTKEEEARMIAAEEERCLEEGAQALLSLAKNSLWSDPKRTLVLLQTATPSSSER